MKRVALSVARDRLSVLINRVAHGGERVVLESHGRPKAALVSLADLDLLEPGAGTGPDAEAEMMRWLEQTEQVLARPPAGDSVLDALVEVREERVAEDAGVYRRKRSAKARSRRKR